jgi:hypothetical protein
MSSFERYDGIMAAITDPNIRSILLVKELTRSYRTGKDVGDYALPAESRNPDETNALDTAGRIFQEEIRIDNPVLCGLIGTLDINDLIVPVLHYTVVPTTTVTIGTAINEVANPTWFSLDFVREGHIRVRQGVAEVVQRLVNRRINPLEFIVTRSRFSNVSTYRQLIDR